MGGIIGAYLYCKLLMKILPRSFYNRNPLEVAEDLVGKILVRRLNKNIITGRIVEVEAYLAFIDEAAHSFRGKTKSNQSLFGEPGKAYIHSMHMQNCLDVVTEEVGIPSSILIRALEPLEGIELMKEFRHKDPLKDLTSGPGKLSQAMNISKDFNGIDLTDVSLPLNIYDDDFSYQKINKGKRIGISKAVDSEYRFFVKDSILFQKNRFERHVLIALKAFRKGKVYENM